MLKTKTVSSQIKAFLDDKIDSFFECRGLTVLGGETVSFQLLYVDEGPGYLPVRPFVKVSAVSDPSFDVTLRDVRLVPVDRPVHPEKNDDGYLRKEPGIFPDLLTPLRYGGKICPSREKLRSVWVEVKIPKKFSGRTEVSVELEIECSGENIVNTVAIDVIAATLPEEELLFTQWLYPDCLASYYNVEAFSEEHWKIVENFVRLAVKRGRNVLYTPLLTPFLNVLPPHYRTPAQLVGVSVNSGEYEFDFSRVDRWVEMCDRAGVKYFEISHFFKQHDADHAAHVYATVDGEYKRIFGWETEAGDREFVRFLRSMLSAFIAHMKKRGDDERCIYHVCDEPGLDTIEQYKKVKASVEDLLAGYKTLDALSDFEFYKEGILAHPVPTTTHAMPFIEAGVPDLWVYYACCELVDYSNCYVAMPSWRTRSLGFQLYKYENITGFLHWGYNYYNNRCSGDAINPYIDLGGEDWVPAGDTFMVYPAQDGTPLESLRMLTLEEALQDYRAMKLAEKYYSHAEVVAAIEAVLGEEISFKRCAKSEAEMLAVREAVNEMIKKAVSR
ncbi:MAG: DUF4091 domain-containing protein [Clostridia bacterium]|nr:DUF4091 domain-containing protein [Clostridia bacterium]